MSTLTSAANRHRIARTLSALIDPATELLNPHSAVTSTLVGYYFRRRVGRVPTIWHMSSLPFLIFWGPEAEGIPTPRGARRLLFRLIDALDRRFIMSAVDAISVLDSETATLARAHFHGKAVTVNRPGIDARRFRFRERSPPTGRAVRLVAHSSFMPARRFEDAVQALAILSRSGYECSLTISGECARSRSYRAYRDQLLASGQDLGVSWRLTFPGEISDEALVQEFHAGDIYLHPHHPQTWGMAVFEAMATGLPAIVSRGAGAHEVLRDGENAILVAPRDPGAIARAVLTLVEDRNLYSKLSRAGAEFVRHELSWANHARELLRVVGAARRT